MIGGETIEQYAQALVHMTIVTAGQTAAAVACFAATSIPLHGKFFIPPTGGWKTWAPYVTSVVASAAVGTGLNEVVP